MGRVVGYGVSQVPTNGMLGGMAYQDPINVTVNNISVGSGTLTGTASQPLQVTGGAYVSGNIGIGTTNPLVALDVAGDARITGIITASGGIQVGATTSIVVGSSFIKNNSVGLGQTTTTGRNAGVSTATGTIIYNSTTGNIELYDGMVGNHRHQKDSLFKQLVVLQQLIISGQVLSIEHISLKVLELLMFLTLHQLIILLSIF
jgi:hypothetical protein